MNRMVTTPVTLSDGTHLPAGSHLALPTWPMKDPDFYGPDADKFDGRRFLERREQPGNEHRWQFVTTSPEHLGFGHGKFHSISITPLPRRESHTIAQSPRH